MKSAALIYLCLFCVQCTLSPLKTTDRQPSYYGPRSTQAILNFAAMAEIAPPRGLKRVTAKELKEGTSLYKKLVSRLEPQIQHLMGTFQSESFAQEFGFLGVLGEDYHLELTNAEWLPERRLLVKYVFTGRVVFDSRAFKGRDLIEVPIKLPRSADRIYNMTLLPRTGKPNERFNPCTDSEYNDELDFWYFWDPDKPGEGSIPACPLLGDNKSVVRTLGTLLREPNTKRTFPRYERLYADNKNGRIFRISIFFGFIGEDIGHLKKKMARVKDDAYRGFKNVLRNLVAKGFKLVENRPDFQIARDGRYKKGINSSANLEKWLDMDGKPIKIVVDLAVVDTEIDSRDLTFHTLASQAFKEADLFVYDGHSGLGGNLDLKQFSKSVNLDPTKHQIFFFNGCSSYPYFNGQFFAAKNKGRAKNSHFLEIVTSGLPTFSDPEAPNVNAFIEPFLEGKKVSWQKILGDVEASNGEENGTYLIGVNGDEDNPTEKP